MVNEKRKNYKWSSEWFCGNRVSNYGIENGRVDYGTLSKAFDCVLNNNIINAIEQEHWEQENGFVDNSEEIEALEEELESIEYTEENMRRIAEIESEIEALRDEETYCKDVFQWYIINDNGAQILKDYTNEIVFYNSELDLYLWGVTHYGTSWDYVLTDIEIERC